MLVIVETCSSARGTVYWLVWFSAPWLVLLVGVESRVLLAGKSCGVPIGVGCGA